MEKIVNVSLIITVLNEANSISRLLDSIEQQTLTPQEIIIVDGASRDTTVSKIKKHPLFKKGKVKVFIKKGNISTGRNFAINKASSEIIAITDAGCILDKNWLFEISSPFKNKKIDVVAGYYKGESESIFQKCLIPYVLVMSDKVKSNFLPSSRSMSIRKNIWGELGGFPEYLDYSEDFLFANQLRENGHRIYFNKKAIVSWIPRSNLTDSCRMFFRFAKGDIEAGILRTKVLLIFARYFLVFYLCFLAILYKSFIASLFILISGLIYIFYSVAKNYKYVQNEKAILILPTIQFASDISILAGSFFGLTKKISSRKPVKIALDNKLLLFILLLYVFIEFYFIRWGAPNAFHPFPYHMDEWHQFNSVRGTFAYGTPNIEGAANGTMFHFILSGLYLVPFTLLNWINPASLAIDDALMRMRTFDLLRLNTIFYGISSIVLFYMLAAYLKISKSAVLLLVFSPIFILLSGYFKYDIALVFWILITSFTFLKLTDKASAIKFLIAGVFVALTIGIKISAIPLLPAYVLSFFIIKERLKYKYLFYGLLTFFISLLIFAMPDVLFGRGNVISLLYENVIVAPASTSAFDILVNPFMYINVIHLPIIFGYGLMFTFFASIFFILIDFIRKGKNSLLIKDRKLLMLINLLLCFWISLIPLRLSAAGNRMLVIMPFIILITFYVLKSLLSKYPYIFRLLTTAIIILSLLQTVSWVAIKYSTPPQILASEWINQNIPPDTIIGIENVPIYQHVPDIVQKEFYFNQSGITAPTLYKYTVLDKNSSEIPDYVIITNNNSANFYKFSDKKSLIKKLMTQGYKKIKVIKTDLSIFKNYGSEFDFYISNLLTVPIDITFYKRD